MRQSYAEHFVPRPQLGRLCADGRVNNCLGAASASTATCAARGHRAGTEPGVLGHTGCPHATATIPMEGLGCARGTAGGPMPSRSADRRPTRRGLLRPGARWPSGDPWAGARPPPRSVLSC